MLLFDIESDGLLDDITKIHCINMVDTETGEKRRFTDHMNYDDVNGDVTDVACPRDGTIGDALELLQSHTPIAGHNIIGYDIPALQKVYPYFKVPSDTTRIDTRIYSKLLYPELKQMDWARIKSKRLPQSFEQHAGSHSLFSWGIRLGGEAKQDFSPEQYGHTWKTMPFTQVMDDYCMQDCVANANLLAHFESKDYSRDAVLLEMRVFEIISWQERVGVPFNVEKAHELARVLYERQSDLRVSAQAACPPFYLPDGKEFIPKRDNKRYGYVAGAPCQKVKRVEFNPNSRAHVARFLTEKYGWSPTELTDTGLPKINDEILTSLPYPETEVIGEYMMITKRLSQLAEGKHAWLKAETDGRIHGRVDQLGCVTSRMSHSSPNLGQVPAVGKPYGAECRELFEAEPRRVIVGCDADAIELCVLGGYMAKFDGGDYIKVILDGDKSQGTDMHTRNQKSLKFTSNKGRSTAKTWFYAMIYGSGDFNLGTIVMQDWDADKLTQFYKAYPAGKRRNARIALLGATSRDRVMSDLPALDKLLSKIKANSKRGYLLGLDRRRLPCRGQHSAPNTVFQGAGAILMKRALVIAFDNFRKEKLDVRPLLNVHDEFQLSALPEEAQRVGEISADSIRLAGEYYDFACPLSGSYEIGTNWSQTH